MSYINAQFQNICDETEILTIKKGERVIRDDGIFLIYDDNQELEIIDDDDYGFIYRNLNSRFTLMKQEEEKKQPLSRPILVKNEILNHQNHLLIKQTYLNIRETSKIKLFQTLLDCSMIHEKDRTRIVCRTGICNISNKKNRIGTITKDGRLILNYNSLHLKYCLLDSTIYKKEQKNKRLDDFSYTVKINRYCTVFKCLKCHQIKYTMIVSKQTKEYHYFYYEHNCSNLTSGGEFDLNKYSIIS